MPSKQSPELTDREIKIFMQKAQKIVDENFDPKQHLPAKVYEYLQPIVNSTCQGYYSCTLMMLGGMPAAMNGACVQIWGQKATPLVTPVFQIADAQAGKSRLFSVLDEWFDSVDDVVSEHVDHLLREARVGDEVGPELPVIVKSINLQSFTMPEFFARCSSKYPQVIFGEGDPRAGLGIDVSPYKGRAFNLDEAYEFWGHLDLLGKVRGDKEAAPSVHASTWNTLVSSGKTRRATRSSTNFGGSRSMPVSISIVGNGHPEKFIAMDRGMVGCHTAASKERFLICLDHSTARHAALPADLQLPVGVPAWTWLPLTPQQALAFGWEKFYAAPDEAAKEELEPDVSGDVVDDAGMPILTVGPAAGYKCHFPDGNETRLRFIVTSDGLRTEFRISSRWLLPDPTGHIREAARRVTIFFMEKPNTILPFEPEARKIMLGNQVVQSIKSQQSTHDGSVAALHANAAGQQGVYAGAMAGLDYAAGGGVLDPALGVPSITVEHVNSTRRLVDISVAIREMWRQGLEDLLSNARGNADGTGGLLMARAVRGNFDQGVFGLAMPTQEQGGAAAAGSPSIQPGPMLEPGPLLPRHVEVENLLAAEAPEVEGPPELWRSQVESHLVSGQADEVGEAAEAEEVVALTFDDVFPEKEFDERGLGDGGVMLLKRSSGCGQVFSDRAMLRQLLLSGKATTTITKLVDNYGINVSCGDGKKRKKIRPTRCDVIAAVSAAFEQYPRLGTYTPRGGDREIVLKAWPTSEEGQKRFHNELMACCRISLSAMSVRRAAFHDARPQVALLAADGDLPEHAGEDAAAVAPADPSAIVAEAPGTPPGGRE
jgi:hypothetical protein